MVLPFGRESFLPEILESVGGRRIELGAHTDRMAYDVERQGGFVTLVYSGLGGPAIANALEMIAANGGRRVVLFGACGGADPDVGIGDLVVAIAAVRGDGASAYYAPIEFPAVFDADLAATLWTHVRSSEEARSHRGIVVTTDASYRQGAEVYEEYSNLAIAVECECATAAVVGLRLGLQVGSLLFCTDNVLAETEGDRSYEGLSDPRVRAGFRIGLDAVLASLT
jgi:uridine phosphorylase